MTLPTTTPSFITPIRTSPWASLGADVDVQPDISDRDILARAGLDWSVALTGLYTDAFQPVSDYRAVIRSDTGRALGVVGLDYTPLQNDQMLGFLRALGRQVNLHIETAGSFKKGAITWFQARLEGLDIRVGDDVTRSYLLASSGHDGGHPLVLGLQGVRVICQNTLALAIREVRASRSQVGLARGYVIRHTKGMPVAMRDALATYQTALEARRTTQAAYEHLASVPLNRDLERRYLDLVFTQPAAASESDRAAAIKRSREERLQQILASPTSQVKGTKDSLFSLMQAVVELADFYRPTRTSDGESSDTSRFYSANFGGSGSDLKERAWQAALEVAA